MTDLSVLIPARNEMFLSNTVEDLLQNIRANTEIVVVLDGGRDPSLPNDRRLSVLVLPESIGQRAATNLAARLAQGWYVMKCDAHCAFDQGFDVKLLTDMQDDWTVAPAMRNLHVFDWVCPNGHRRYQGKSGPCTICGEPTEREIVWIAKTNPRSRAYCFDAEPHFRYFRAFNKRPEGRGDLTETMSLQGSCWLMTRQKYVELDICDEAFGSWGSQGIEVAVKTWLSGGQVMVNNKTWYAHAFRTQGGDWGFPYPISGNQVEHAKQMARDLFFNNKWPKRVKPLSWLVKKFWPVPGWTEADLAQISARDEESSKGIVYYTDNQLDPEIMAAAQRQIERAELPVVSVSLKPLDFGNNIVLYAERGVLTMFKQILAGLEASDAEVIFFAEHDVLYHPAHFRFMPKSKDRFYYNQNAWRVDAKTGKALFYYANSTSGLCAYRDLLIEHYRKRVEMVEEHGFSRNMGFEPGTHGRAERVDDYKSETWMSEFPNIDIRHGHNLTPTRWRKEQFRNQRFTKGWTEADEVPGWGRTSGRIKEILRGLSN